MKQSICQIFGVAVFAILGFVFSASPVSASWPVIQGYVPENYPESTNGILSIQVDPDDGDGIGVRFSSFVDVPFFTHVNWYVCDENNPGTASWVVVLAKVTGVFTLETVATSSPVLSSDIPACSSPGYFLPGYATSTTFSFNTSMPIYQDEEYFAYITKVVGTGSVSGNLNIGAYDVEGQVNGMYAYIATTSGNYVPEGDTWGGVSVILGFELWTNSTDYSTDYPDPILTVRCDTLDLSCHVNKGITTFFYNLSNSTEESEWQRTVAINNLIAEATSSFPFSMIAGAYSILSDENTYGSLKVVDSTIPAVLPGGGTPLVLDFTDKFDFLLNATSGMYGMTSPDTDTTVIAEGDTFLEVTLPYWKLFLAISAVLYVFRRTSPLLFGDVKGAMVSQYKHEQKIIMRRNKHS